MNSNTTTFSHDEQTKPLSKERLRAQATPLTESENSAPNSVSPLPTDPQSTKLESVPIITAFSDEIELVTGAAQEEGTSSARADPVSEENIPGKKSAAKVPEVANEKPTPEEEEAATAVTPVEATGEGNHVPAEPNENQTGVIEPTSEDEEEAAVTPVEATGEGNHLPAAPDENQRLLEELKKQRHVYDAGGGGDCAPLSLLAALRLLGFSEEDSLRALQQDVGVPQGHWWTHAHIQRAANARHVRVCLFNPSERDADARMQYFEPRDALVRGEVFLQYEPEVHFRVCTAQLLTREQCERLQLTYVGLLSSLVVMEHDDDEGDGANKEPPKDNTAGNGTMALSVLWTGGQQDVNSIPLDVTVREAVEIVCSQIPGVNPDDVVFVGDGGAILQPHKELAEYSTGGAKMNVTIKLADAPKDASPMHPDSDDGDDDAGEYWSDHEDWTDEEEVDSCDDGKAVTPEQLKRRQIVGDVYLLNCGSHILSTSKSSASPNAEYQISSNRILWDVNGATRATVKQQPHALYQKYHLMNGEYSNAIYVALLSEGVPINQIIEHSEEDAEEEGFVQLRKRDEPSFLPQRHLLKSLGATVHVQVGEKPRIMVLGWTSSGKSSMCDNCLGFPDGQKLFPTGARMVSGCMVEAHGVEKKGAQRSEILFVTETKYNKIIASFRSRVSKATNSINVLVETMDALSADLKCCNDDVEYTDIESALRKAMSSLERWNKELHHATNMIDLCQKYWNRANPRPVQVKHKDHSVTTHRRVVLKHISFEKSARLKSFMCVEDDGGGLHHIVETIRLYVHGVALLDEFVLVDGPGIRLEMLASDQKSGGGGGQVGGKLRNTQQLTGVTRRAARDADFVLAVMPARGEPVEVVRRATALRREAQCQQLPFAIVLTMADLEPAQVEQMAVEIGEQTETFVSPLVANHQGAFTQGWTSQSHRAVLELDARRHPGRSPKKRFHLFSQAAAASSSSSTLAADIVLAAQTRGVREVDVASAVIKDMLGVTGLVRNVSRAAALLNLKGLVKNVQIKLRDTEDRLTRKNGDLETLKEILATGREAEVLKSKIAEMKKDIKRDEQRVEKVEKDLKKELEKLLKDAQSRLKFLDTVAMLFANDFLKWACWGLWWSNTFSLGPTFADIAISGIDEAAYKGFVACKWVSSGLNALQKLKKTAKLSPEAIRSAGLKQQLGKPAMAICVHNVLVKHGFIDQPLTLKLNNEKTVEVPEGVTLVVQRNSLTLADQATAASSDDRLGAALVVDAPVVSCGVAEESQAAGSHVTKLLDELPVGSFVYTGKTSVEVGENFLQWSADAQKENKENIVASKKLILTFLEKSCDTLIEEVEKSTKKALCQELRLKVDGPETDDSQQDQLGQLEKKDGAETDDSQQDQLDQLETQLRELKTERSPEEVQQDICRLERQIEQTNTHKFELCELLARLSIQ